MHGDKGYEVTGTEMEVRPLTVNQTLCADCGACVAVCAFDAIFLRAWGIEIIEEECTLCGLCVIICPTQALIKDE